MNGHTSGFTLIEVLVAIAIFSIVMVALGNYLMSIPKVNLATTDQQAAMLASRGFFEQVALSLDTTAEFNTATASSPPVITAAAPTAAGTACTKTVAAVTVGTTTNNVLRVTVACALRGRTYTFAQDFGRPV